MVNPVAGENLCRDWILTHIPEAAVARYENLLEPYREEFREALAERFDLDFGDDDDDDDEPEPDHGGDDEPEPEPPPPARPPMRRGN